MTENKFKAPKNKFRVICVDTFDGTDWIEGDYNTKKEALDIAKKTGGTMLKTHVYDDTGQNIKDFGTF